MATSKITLQINTPDILTDRELEVAALVAQALNNDEIAASLVISERTVKAHITNIRQKLNLKNRVAITLWWLSAVQGAKIVPEYNSF